METIQTSLEHIGLSAKAAKLYLAVLQLGSGTVQDIATRAGLVRTTCYTLLEELQRRGLVATTRSGKRTVYVAESPTVLLRNMEHMNSLVHSLVPTLTHVLSGNSKRPKVEIFEGISGVWRAYEDVLAGHDYEVKAFLPADDSVYMAGENNVREYIRKRVLKNISMRAIMQKTPLMDMNYAKYNKNELREARFVDAKKFPLPVEIDLYPPHNIAITSFRDGIGLIVRSEPMYIALSSLFELAWLSSKNPRIK